MLCSCQSRTPNRTEASSQIVATPVVNVLPRGAEQLNQAWSAVLPELVLQCRALLWATFFFYFLVTMGGRWPGCLADLLLTGLGLTQINPMFLGNPEAQEFRMYWFTKVDVLSTWWIGLRFGHLWSYMEQVGPCVHVGKRSPARHNSSQYQLLRKRKERLRRQWKPLPTWS
jgi:hypothetical protein